MTQPADKSDTPGAEAEPEGQVASRPQKLGGWLTSDLGRPRSVAPPARTSEAPRASAPSASTSEEPQPSFPPAAAIPREASAIGAIEASILTGEPSPASSDSPTPTATHESPPLVSDAELSTHAPHSDLVAADDVDATSESSTLTPQFLPNDELGADEDDDLAVFVPPRRKLPIRTAAVVTGAALAVVIVAWLGHRRTESPNGATKNSTAETATLRPTSPSAAPEFPASPDEPEPAAEATAVGASDDRGNATSPAAVSSNASEDPHAPGVSTARFPDLPRSTLMILEEAAERKRQAPHGGRAPESEDEHATPPSE